MFELLKSYIFLGKLVKHRLFSLQNFRFDIKKIPKSKFKNGGGIKHKI